MTRQELLNQLFNLVEDHFTNEQLDKWLWYCYQVERELACATYVNPVVKNGVVTWTDSDLATLRTFSTMVQITYHAAALWETKKVCQTVPQKNDMSLYHNTTI